MDDGTAASGVSTADLERQDWFHSMDLDGYTTRSIVYPPELPPNYHLFPVWEMLADLRLEGLRCLDLGTYDGMTAFVLDRLGAGHVDAICQYDLPRFRLAKQALQADRVHYHPGSQIEDLIEKFGEAAFDLIVVSAALHHMTSPQEALFICRRLLKPGGFLLLESLVVEGDTPALVWNTEVADPVYGVPTILLPTRSGLKGMLKFSAFDAIAEIELSGGRRARETNYDRVTTLCRAARPADVQNRSDLLTKIHTNAPWTGRIDFRKLQTPAGPDSTITYTGPAERRFLDIWSYKPRTPLQPDWADPTPGRWTQYRLGLVSDFMQLMTKHHDHHWSALDIYPIAMRYPGEVFPEGQAWTIKQLGNLFCLDHIIELGSRRVLEMGAGLNLYFDHHLPENCESWMVDASGFYEADLFKATLSRRKRTKFVDGLLGQTLSDLPRNYFDAVVSVSVIEHVATPDIAGAAQHMFDVLAPGGWALHSLDVSETEAERVGKAWLEAFRRAGFLLPDQIDLDFASSRQAGAEVFLEPLSIIQRFHGGYAADPFAPRRKPVALHSRWGTILVAVRKPPV